MPRVAKDDCPNHNKLIKPLFEALVELGGSGSNEEIYNTIVSDMNLPEDVLEIPHKNGGKNGGAKIKYELAWARTTLKNYGAIASSTRGVWYITPDFADKKTIDPKAVMKIWQTYGKENSEENESMSDEDAPEEIAPWRSELLEILQSMDPYKFEKLIQLLLRESGFTSVKVTQKSGDGGIDGVGKFCINGMLSFNVAFQCKRYSGSVSASSIRDFRGSLTTDIEKGLFITTGTFTQSAINEAAVPGKQEIDLIDSDDLIDRLLDCKIGVTEEKIYKVDRKFFSEF